MKRIRHVSTHQDQIEELAALALAPLVEVAWADGHVTEGERQGVIEASRTLGLGQYAEFCRSTLLRWLTDRPPTEALERWRRLLAAELLNTDGRAARIGQQDLIEEARRIAKMDERSFVEGRSLDPRAGIVPEEQRVLDDLEAALKTLHDQRDR